MFSGVKCAFGLLGAGLIVSGTVIAPVHAAPGDDPYAGGRSYVKTVQCPVPDPWPGPELRTWVDVWNKISSPSDGLPAPAIALIASTRVPVREPAVLENMDGQVVGQVQGVLQPDGQPSPMDLLAQPAQVGTGVGLGQPETIAAGRRR